MFYVYHVVLVFYLLTLTLLSVHPIVSDPADLVHRLLLNIFQPFVKGLRIFHPLFLFHISVFIEGAERALFGLVRP